MNEKKTTLIVLLFVFIVAIPSTIFLFSDGSVTGKYFEGPLYTWEYGGKQVMVYPNVILAYTIKNNYGTGFYYDSPVFQARLDKRMGCPRNCWSVRYEDVRNFERLGLRIDFYGNRLYGCFCPEQLEKFS